VDLMVRFLKAVAFYFEKTQQMAKMFQSEVLLASQSRSFAVLWPAHRMPAQNLLQKSKKSLSNFLLS